MTTLAWKMYMFLKHHSMIFYNVDPLVVYWSWYSPSKWSNGSMILMLGECFEPKRLMNNLAAKAVACQPAMSRSKIRCKDYDIISVYLTDCGGDWLNSLAQGLSKSRNSKLLLQTNKQTLQNLFFWKVTTGIRKLFLINVQFVFHHTLRRCLDKVFGLRLDSTMSGIQNVPWCTY